MTRTQSLFSRFLLFLVGIGIIILAFFLITGGRELNRIDAFVWTSIGLIYLLFFIPFFFSAINIANFSGKVPVLSIVWTGIMLYAAASIVIILLVRTDHVSLNTAIIIQAILLFMFFIDVYFAYFASAHVSSVAAEESSLRQYITEIKSKAQVLSLSVNRLPAEYEKAQKNIQRVLEDIRFISPVKDAGDLEPNILRSLDKLSEIIDGVQSGAHPVSLDNEIANLQMLVNKRKLSRN